MSLQLIFGGSGSGKSDYVYEKILEQSGREQDRTFFVLVPEQFTMQTQAPGKPQHYECGRGKFSKAGLADF